MGRTDRFFPFIQHGSHRNDVSLNSSVVVCIHCCGNVFTESLPSDDRKDTYCDVLRH
jgi:hypothetical protein